MKVLWALAARNVVRNGRRSAITLAAVAMGVLVVLVLKGLSDGFVDLVVDNVVEGRTSAIQVHRAGYMKNRDAVPLGLSLSAAPAFAERLQRVPGVRAVAPRIQFSGLVSDASGQSTFLGTGIDPAAEKQVCRNWGRDLTPESRDLEVGDGNEALLGIALARSFGVKPHGASLDDTARLTLAVSGPSGRLNAMSIAVKGITETAFRFDNKRLISVPLPFAQELLGMPGQVTEYAVAVEHRESIHRVAADLRAALGPQYEVHTWREIQPYMDGVVRRQEVIVAISALIFFLVIVVGISNAMSSAVAERVREIGTMLAVGASRARVRTLFLLESLMLGLLGGLIGAMLGRAVVAVVAAFGVPVKQIVNAGDALIRPSVSWEFTALAVLAGAAVALAAALVPAWSASRQSPADALRT